MTCLKHSKPNLPSIHTLGRYVISLYAYKAWIHYILQTMPQPPISMSKPEANSKQNVRETKSKSQIVSFNGQVSTALIIIK
jgi:hypothetical protein